MNGTKVFKTGSVLTLPVPAGGVTVGQALEIGGHFGFSQATVKAEDVDETSIFTLDLSGVFEVEASATAAINIGDAIYFNALAGAGQPKFGDSAGRLVGYATYDTRPGAPEVDEPLVAAGQKGLLLVNVQIFPKTTRAEAIEDAGGADA